MRDGQYKVRFLLAKDVNHNGSLMLGATKEKSLMKNNVFTDSYTYCYCGSNGRLYGQEIANQKVYVTLKENDIIDILYDIDNKTISYSINNKLLSTMFKNVETPLYPYVELCGQYTEIILKLISFQKISN